MGRTDKRSTGKRSIGKLLALSAASITTVLVSSHANAQVDVNPPLPNVLLLVDSSGSMEYQADGTELVTCTYNNNASDLTRWHTLVEVLTGTVQNRGCLAVPRDDANFITEFTFGGETPYDSTYHLPHHRLVSNDCVAGPGTVPSTPFEWPAGAIAYHAYNNTGTACGVAGFAQASDGLMDTFRDRVRFGLMTFDPLTDEGTGVAGGVINAATGFAGLWSYYNNWQGGGTAASGYPPACSGQMMEVGARNAAAPPWEGRMIAFGPPDATLLVTQQQYNDRIQEALLAMRPYGATPLNGMMADAYEFLRNDADSDPLNVGYDFGPKDDGYVNEGCRDQYVIVLSDGEPNLDLRPYCEAVGGVCPFPDKPEEIASNLFNTADPDDSVQVFAVGFGLSSGTGFDCNTLSIPADLNSGGQCDGATGSLEACCNLSRIAYEGGTSQAYFADNTAQLKTAISQVLAQIAAGSTSRTSPVFASVGATQIGSSNAPGVAFEFTSSFSPAPGALWGGNLERHRWQCNTVSGALVAELQDVEVLLGDDFSANLNSGSGPSRVFYTVVGTQSLVGSDPFIDSESTIRPNLAVPDDDGMGTYTGTWETGSITGLANIMQAAPAAMGMYPLPAACSATDLNAASEADCAYKVMNWQLGGSNGASFPSRENAFGAIYHASPGLLGAPTARLRDPSYTVFAQAQAERPVVLYTVTTDGQVHAFKVASNDPSEPGIEADTLENNELWSFMPPHALKGIVSQYSATQQILLDGTPVVTDTIFERTQAQAQLGGEVGGASWHSVLVAGGRGAGGFYYALDVTDPTAPEFLWQISTDTAGNPLFSDTTGTPTVARISMDDNGTLKEVGVAILPGGEGTLGVGTCARQGSSFAHIEAAYIPRSNVRCWNDGPGRSLTIVRLDTGEIIKTFRGVAADGPATINAGQVKIAGFDSPITGQPVAFPNLTGQTANRIYVADADGTLWRIDLSSTDPLDWEAHVAWDGYPLGSDNDDEGEPVQTKVLVSLDGEGNTVLLYATGDQETFHATATMKTRVWSVLEKPVAVGTVPFSTEANWYIPFDGGKRVTGPMAIFDEVVYFATFTPQPIGTNSCSDGFGSVWGVHFKDSYNSGSGPRPDPMLPVDPNANPIVFVDEQVQPAGTIVFGVAVTQEPACFETAAVTDSYSGSYNSITSSTPPSFVLSYHTGTGGTAAQGAKTKTQTKSLPTPKNSARIDSWAGVVE
jgi:type IV pilus assembly protein PilY1